MNEVSSLVPCTLRYASEFHVHTIHRSVGFLNFTYH